MASNFTSKYTTGVFRLCVPQPFSQPLHATKLVLGLVEATKKGLSDTPNPSTAAQPNPVANFADIADLP
jgi:hypothetical protein